MRRARFALPFAVAALACGACRASPVDPGADPGSRSSVVLIVVDALRADHLGTYGYSARPTSPNIDRWAGRGLVFERAWATSPWTLPSFGSILTGHLPSAHAAGIEVGEGAGAAVEAGAEVEVVAARNFVTLPEAVPTVAGILAAQGFATGALVANPFLDPRFGLGRGFAYYDHYDTSNSEVRRAAEVVDLALEWIDANSSRPFFLLVHLFDPHLDYDAPAPFGGRFAVTGTATAATTAAGEEGLELPVQGLWPIRNRLTDMSAAERDFITAAYDEEIAYVDAEVGRFLQGLEDRGALDSALVALTADHGEELFEHGGFEHGHTMFDEVLRVPLILWGPRVAPGRESAPVSLIDLVPTILEAAGVASSGGDARAFPEHSLPGLSLLDTARSTWPEQRALIAERLLYGPEAKAIVRWPYKAILEIESGKAMLFDLEEDPGEHHDLAAQRPAALTALLGELAERLSAAGALGVATAADIDEGLLRRLRALGYIR